MLSRLRLHPQKLWWVSMLVPPFVIMNRYLINGLIACYVARFPPMKISFDTVRAYVLWGYFDVFSQWCMAGIIATFLFSNHDSLKSFGRLKRIMPWGVAIMAFALESYGRSYVREITSIMTILSPIDWSYVIVPPKMRISSTSITWRNNAFYSWSSLVWSTRPLFTFAMMTFLIWYARLVVQMVKVRLEAGRLMRQKIA